MTEELERKLRQAAAHFPYPPTPGVQPVYRRPPAARPRLRAAWALALIAVLLVAALAIEPVRAAVFAVLRIGVVQIFVGGETPTPAALPTRLQDLEGLTTLEAARQAAGFPLRLPPDYGPPDYVYVQEWGGPVVIMAWVDPDDPERLALSLYQLSAQAWAMKMIEEGEYVVTEVNGRRAIWTTAPHIVRFRRDGRVREETALLVEGRALVWSEGGVTYRLETTLSMEAAIQIAESLR
mgnify:CR=1 FL=1